MAHLKLKYCGNHTLDDFRITRKGKSQYLGVVFAESKRQVTAEQLQHWLEQLADLRGKKLVGLFVNADTETVIRVLNHVSLDVIQLHGHESPEVAAAISEATKLPVWKVLHHDEEALSLMKTYEHIVDGYVVDCKVKDQWGGSGQSFDWTAIPQYTEEAKRQGVPCFIAGGISDDNIAELLPYAPDGVDLSSGLESEGAKDEKRMKRLEKRIMDAGFTIP